MEPRGVAAEGAQSIRARPSRLVDVAQLAGVSRATAARVLGGYGKASPDAVARVTAAAAELSYRTNELARAIRAGRSRTIGLVIADISNSFFDRMARAVIDRAALSGYQVLVAHTDDLLDLEVRAVQVFIDKRVDGLIVAASSPREYSHLAADGPRHSLPLVLIDRRIPDLHAATVATNDYASAREVVRLFVERGHRHLGLLVSSTGPVGLTGEFATVSSVDDRVRGFVDQLSASGLSMRPGWLRYGRSDHAEATAAALEMLSPRVRPTAVLTTNNTMALGLIDACRSLGLILGREVSLVTFDDSDWAKVFDPPISVIERPIHTLGEAAVDLLLQQIETGCLEAPLCQIDNRLLDRGSVRVIGGRRRVGEAVEAQ